MPRSWPTRRYTTVASRLSATRATWLTALSLCKRVSVLVPVQSFRVLILIVSRVTAWADNVNFAPQKPVAPGFDPISEFNCFATLIIMPTFLYSRPSKRQPSHDVWSSDRQPDRIYDSSSGVCRLEGWSVLLRALFDGIEDQAGCLSSGSSF